MRQHVPRVSAKRRATVTSVPTASSIATRTPESRPASNNAAESPVRWIPASAASPLMSPRPSSIPNRNLPGRPASAGCGLNRGVQLTDQPPDIRGSSDPAGQRRRDDVPYPLVRVRRQQARRCKRMRNGRGGLSVADTANLDVAARGEFHRRRRPVPCRVRQGFELRRGDHPARKSHPSQRAVRGMMYLQRAGAGVLIAGPGHQFTVRPSCWPARQGGSPGSSTGAAACAHP